MTTSTNLIIFNCFYLMLGAMALVQPTAWMVAFWLLYAIGNGTIGHRYFAHQSFSVSRPMHWVLAVWCTIAAYSPTSYWQVQHRHHHRHTDRRSDIHSPGRGIWMSFLGWNYSRQRIESVFDDKASVVNLLRARRDPVIKFTSDWFLPINLSWLVVLAAIDINLLLASGAAVICEQIRLGLVNSVCHISGLPGNYRNHDTADHSHNNVLIGLLGLGFGWHNNHHNDASKLILTERWWEIDIEGMAGFVLAKL